MINAKAETITEKASFKNPFKRKRCLVLSDGFYEWKKITPKEKIPYRIKMEDDSLFTMAGIWDTWKNEEGDPINSFSIITTSPNELMENIHNRMPVILKKEDEKAWLNDNDTDYLQSLLKPFPAKEMTAYSISKLVNTPRNDTPEIMEPFAYNT